MSDLLSLDEARSRVAQGAALLDQEWPGWARQINLGKLDMGDQCACVLGQLEGNFHDACRRFFGRLWANDTASALGFYVFVGSMGMRHQQYKLLQDAWIEAIGERLIADPSPVETTEAVR